MVPFACITTLVLRTIHSGNLKQTWLTLGYTTKEKGRLLVKLLCLSVTYPDYRPKHSGLIACLVNHETTHTCKTHRNYCFLTWPLTAFKGNRFPGCQHAHFVFPESYFNSAHGTLCIIFDTVAYVLLLFLVRGDVKIPYSAARSSPL